MTARPARAVALIILDGWGYREERESNAILMADTPNWNRIWAHESRTLLTASGRAVGLPDGQMGNSEVGHLNLGAGRIVMQDLVRIGSAIDDGSFFRNRALVQACDDVNASGGTLHLLGHDHQRPAEARRMESLEVRVLAGLGVADPYAADA